MTLNYFQKFSKLVFVCICLFSFQANAQADFVSRLMEFSSDGIIWDNSARYLSDYDENGWVTELQLQNWTEANWVNDDHEINTYNTNGTIAQKITKAVYTANPDIYTRTTYTYSATQKLMLTQSERLNDSNVWEISGKTEYVYDASDNCISETRSSLNTLGIWIYLGRYLYEYNANGYETTMTNQSYNSSEGFYTWYTTEMGYDSLNRSNTVTQKIYNNDSVTSTIIRHYYFIADTNNYDYYIQEGAQLSNPMQLMAKGEYSYNTDNTLYQTVYYQKNGDNWQALQRQSYFYPNLNMDEFQKKSLTAWPNPFQNTLNIKTDKTAIGSPYTFYNILGENVHSGVITSEETTIESQIKSAGTYFVRIGNSKEAIKVIKK